MGDFEDDLDILNSLMDDEDDDYADNEPPQVFSYQVRPGKKAEKKKKEENMDDMTSVRRMQEETTENVSEGVCSSNQEVDQGGFGRVRDAKKQPNRATHEEDPGTIGKW